jgi:hypothetical protein
MLFDPPGRRSALTTTDKLIEDLEVGLAAARAFAAGGGDVDDPAPAETAGSMMPGGVDSAPVSAAPSEPAVEPGILSGVEAAAKPVLADVEHAAETEGLDLMHELKEGKAVKEVARLVNEAPDALESIIRAISDIAQGVRI